MNGSSSVASSSPVVPRGFSACVHDFIQYFGLVIPKIVNYYFILYLSYSTHVVNSLCFV